jgi:heme-degrading monooxygenase HmoA
MASYMLVRHKVRDFTEWKRGYDAHLPKRIESGLTEKYLLQGANDPNEVIILFEARDLNRAKAFTESAELKETMQKVGVVDRPDIYFLNG